MNRSILFTSLLAGAALYFPGPQVQSADARCWCEKKPVTDIEIRRHHRVGVTEAGVEGRRRHGVEVDVREGRRTRVEGRTRIERQGRTRVEHEGGHEKGV